MLLTSGVKVQLTFKDSALPSSYVTLPPNASPTSPTTLSSSSSSSPSSSSCTITTATTSTGSVTSTGSNRGGGGGGGGGGKKRGTKLPALAKEEDGLVVVEENWVPSLSTR